MVRKSFFSPPLIAQFSSSDSITETWYSIELKNSKFPKNKENVLAKQNIQKEIWYVYTWSYKVLKRAHLQDIFFCV